MDARSYADRMCANYLTNLLFCQPLFPDSLSVSTIMIGKSSRERWLYSGQKAIIAYEHCRPRARFGASCPVLPLRGSQANAVGLIHTARRENAYGFSKSQLCQA